MQAGDKVEYKVGDKWQKGVIHAVRKAQDTNDNDIILGYLVDTGKDARVDERIYDAQDEVLSERMQKHIDDGDDILESLENVLSEKGIPKSKIQVEKIRQPEQVDVLPDDIRAVK